MKRLIFLIVLVMCTSNAFGRSTRFTKERREQVQQRREQILNNGNIEKVYPKRFKIDWFIVNNRAYMGIFFREN